ncbi:MAG: FHA domain-containing protein [Myxococcota bacterium]
MNTTLPQHSTLAPPTEPLFSAELGLRQSLHELGFTTAGIGLIQLWPQIIQSWSNGPISEEDQHRILDLAEDIIFDQNGWDLLRNWLSFRPPQTAQDAALCALSSLQELGHLPKATKKKKNTHFMAGWTQSLPFDALGVGRLHVRGQPTAFGLIQDDVTAGRGRQNAIHLSADNTVSRQHCVFQLTPQGWVVEDRSSVAGTRVNGQRVLRRLLIGGETIQIGRYKLHFILDDGELPDVGTDHD